MTTSLLREATPADAAAIARIYTQGIEDRCATFETRPRTDDDVRAWFATQDRYPTVVLEREGRIDGWASLSPYRPRACYAGIAEFSIYLAREVRGQWLGAPLLAHLIDVARDRGYSKLVSRIFSSNTASRALCRRLGFREVGTYEKHGPLDGRWLDVVIVERLIPDNLTEHP